MKKNIKNISDFYTKKLFNETGLLCSSGNNFGNFGNHITINLCSQFNKDNITILLDFNKRFLSDVKSLS